MVYNLTALPFSFTLYNFVYQKALIRTFHISVLTICTITAIENEFRKGFCTQKPVLNVCFKDFWYTKINPTQIWYDKFN